MQVAPERAADAFRVSTPGTGGVTGRDRVDRDQSRLDRLRDPFAGQRIDDVGGVTDVQHAPVGERVVLERSGDRPGAVRRLGLGGRPEHRPHARALEQLPPTRVELLAGHARTAQHAEPDIRATFGKREHPGIPGEQVGLEEHVEAGVVDATEVLPEGVPRSELGWGRRSQAAPHKGIVAVRRDEKARPYRVTLGHRGGDGLAVAVHVDPADGNAVAHLDSRSPGGVDDGGVELDARHDRGVVAVGRQRE